MPNNMNIIECETSHELILRPGVATSTLQPHTSTLAHSHTQTQWRRYEHMNTVDYDHSATLVKGYFYKPPSARLYLIDTLSHIQP